MLWVRLCHFPLLSVERERLLEAAAAGLTGPLSLGSPTTLHLQLIKRVGDRVDKLIAPK